MSFEVALRMRNFADLQARLARSETISRAEMAATYYPTAADHDAVVQWLRSEGLTVTRTDDNRLAVFGRGSVTAVGQAFQVTFARVATDEGEFTSAITAPALPAGVASVVLGVHGLQPHLRPHVLTRSPLSHPAATIGGVSGFLPAQIATAYNAATLGATGAGQTIAIYGLAFPQTSDLSTFWQDAGVTQSAANVQTVRVAGGPAASPGTPFIEEVTLDAEWAGGLAPGATIRIYSASETDPAGGDEVLQQIYADLPSQPNLHILSISIGGNEEEIDRDYLVIEAQFMANLASAGVTVLAATGDTGAYADGVLQPSYPSTDPDVTAVGGTSLVLNPSNGIASETAWTDSGGGISAVFARPAWQTGAGLPAGTTRLIPDVAAVADLNTPLIIVYGGRPSAVGGTSCGAPIWAAFCALMNQQRLAAGQTVLGPLNPKIYPLLGTAAVHDITIGNNGYYTAGAGYDLCTGIGSPNVGVLVQALGSSSAAPVVVASLGNRATVLGQPATFYASAVGAPPLGYQWQRLPSGTSTWSNLTDGGTYLGSGTAQLVVNGATAAMDGDQFRCVVSNPLGSATGVPAALAVTAVGTTTLAGWPEAPGSANGVGWTARFSVAGGVRTDAAGTIYVADSNNNTIRKITPAGLVTTVAGTVGASGGTDGGATAALFNGIGGVAPDAAGNLYVADSGNYTIRRIAPDGTVSTLAGSAGSPSHLDGTGKAARFVDPQNLAIAADGTIFVADGNGNTIRRVTPAGAVTTFAGTGTAGSANGPGTAAQFRDPTGVAVDTAGNVYVADHGNHTVRKITAAGVVTTLAGSAGRSGSTDGSGGRFNGPAGVAVDLAGNVYVADSGNDTIREITPAGIVSTLAGSGAAAESVDGPPSVSRFNTPGDIALDASGVLYVADAGNCTIRRLATTALPVPVVATAPVSQSFVIGGNATLSVVATGPGPFSYQWYLNGVAIPGATAPAYTATAGGSYTVVITNLAGSVTSSAAVVTMITPGHLTNLSVLSVIQHSLSLGFVIGGSGASGSENLLVRATGPALAAAPFNVPGVMTDPTLTVIRQSDGATVAADTGWAGTADNQAQVTATDAAVGAFALTNPASLDSALVTALPLSAGGYTANVAGKSGDSGYALTEVYDATPAGTATASTPHLVNLSCLTQLAPGATLTLGFVIGGDTGKTVLIRVSGPTLAAAPFSISGTVPDPQLSLETLASPGTILAQNAGWAGDPQTAAVAASVGAFPFTSAASKDSAVVQALQPGTPYTVQATSVSGVGGWVLVEIYEVP